MGGGLAIHWQHCPASAMHPPAPVARPVVVPPPKGTLSHFGAPSAPPLDLCMQLPPFKQRVRSFSTGHRSKEQKVYRSVVGNQKVVNVHTHYHQHIHVFSSV